MGAFDDLVPQKSSGTFDEFVPKTKPSDVGKALVSGAVKGVGTTLAGGGNIVAQGVNRLSEALTGVNPLLRSEDPLKPVSTAIDESKSEGGKRAKELSTPKGDILKPETWSLGEDPSIGGYLQNIADVGGQFATPAAVAGATAKASKLVQHIAGAATGGLQASGAGAEEEGKRVRTMPEDQLKTAYTAYNDYLKRGMDPSEARERTALDAEAGGAVGAGVPGAAEGVIVQALLRRGIRLPTFGASRPAQIASAGLAGGAGEAVQEVAEGVGQRAGSNIAAGGNQNVTDDSFGNAVLGFAGGKMAGAGIEALAGAKPAETGSQPLPGPLPTPPEGGGSTPGPQGEAEPASAGAPAAPVGDSFDRKDVIGIASRVVSELTSKEQGFEFKGADGVVQKQDPQPLTREEIEERDFLRANVENPDAIAERYGFALRNDTPPFTEEMLGKALGTLDAQNNLTRILRDFRPVPRPDGTPANMDMRELINQARGEAGQSPLSEADWQRIQGFDAPEPMVSKDKPGATASAKKSFPFNTESAALQFAKNRYGEGNFTIAPHPKVPGRFAVTEGRNEASGTPATATPIPTTAKKGGARQANAPAERVGAQVADAGGAARAATGAEGVTAAANEAATSPTNDLPEPTEAQAAAGNYKKGHTRVAGLDISIENPTGSTRRGTDRDGTPWEVTMSSHYGYIKRTEGKDGEQVDVYVKPDTAPDYNGPVFVVNQVEPGSGKFDEHKVIIGARSQKEAEQIYDAHFQDGSGPQRRRTVGMVTMNGFKQWLKEGDTTKPFTRSPKLSAPSLAREQAAESKADTKPEPPEKAVSTPTVERRKDSETRKRVDDMSPDELRAALLTDRMTGLHNGRWMEDNLSRFSHFVAFDADGLKWINDNMGHSSGDELLKAYGRALQQVSENSVKLRDGGDEYFILANSQEEAENLSKQVEDILAEASISQEVDGEIITVKGIGVSYGIGQSVEEADTGLNESKRERTATGKRAARNEAPPTVVRTAAAGRENRVDQAAGRVDENAQRQERAAEGRDVRGDNPPERADSEAGGGGVPALDEMADGSRPAREAPDSPQQSEVAQKTPADAGVSASEALTEAEKAAKIEAQRAARTGKGKTGPLFRRGDAKGGLEPGEVKAVLSKLGVQGNVVATEADLPLNLRMSIKSQGAEGQTNGLFDPLTGEIWVNASRMSSMTMTAAVALHESAHRGLRTLFGEGLTPVLNGIYATNQNVKKRAGELMDKYGYDQVRATEEVLADMALAGHAKQLKGWQRLVAFIREWLANRGLKINFSDEAVELIVAGAVEVGKRKAVSVLQGDIPAFSQGQASGGTPFYSTLERRVGELKLDNAVAGIWKGAIQNLTQKGVKQDEITWSGVLDWLDTQQGKITRQQVSDFLRDNGVQVQETVMSGPGDDHNVREFHDMSERVWNSATDRERAELRAEYWAQSTVAEGDTKFAQYQLPGGQNYRELLLTLPEAKSDAQIRYEQLRDLKRDFVGSELEEYNNLRAQVLRDKERRPSSFKSSHFDQPNILAHVRFNERTDADGKRVLFLEEIQSDWAQKGKREGFGGSNQLTAEERDELGRLNELNISRDTPAIVARRRELSQRNAFPKGVPSAPFVGKTESWVALALKRMIRYAAENGFDRVAWTTGDQQAERYDLSKRIEAIGYRKYGDGTYGVRAEELHGGTAFERTVPEAELDGLVGKELAKKIIAGEGRDGEAELANGDVIKMKMLSGLDLKVGGEGMRAFYDKIVPNVANDVLKKLGGQRVTEVQVPTKNTARSPLYSGQEFSKNQGFDITSKMRETALAGQPLFSRDPGVPAQTDTAAFKNWFGDSKVVDENGKPLVVYHGTTAKAFSEFDTSAEGAHFGTGEQAQSRAAKKRGLGGKTKAMPVYLNLKNPLRLPDIGVWNNFNNFHRELSVNDHITAKQADEAWDAYQRTDADGWSTLKGALEKNGHDGIVYENELEGSGDSYIAFRPEQIKSAIGNRGTFDSNDPNILFSRGEDWKSALTQKRIAEEIGNYLHTTRSFNAFHKTVGTQMHKAKVDTLPGRSPGDTGTFGKVYNIGQSYLRDVSRFANESADLAPDVLPQIRDVKDALTFAKTATKADIEAVSKVVFEGTLDKMLYSPAELKRIGLTDKQVEMYGQTRDAINHSLDMLVSAEAARLAKDEVSPSVILEAKEKPYTGAMLIRQALVDKAAEKQADLPAYAERLRGLADEIFAKMERVSELKAEAYAPLMRFGQHTIYVTEKNDDGKDVQLYFGMYESAAQANRAAKALAEEYPGADISRGLLSQDSYKMFQGLSPDTLELFADLVTVEVEGETVPISQTDIYQQYLKLAVNNRSALKRMIKRKGVAGYSEDVSRVLAAFLTSNARAAAGNYHLGEMLEAVNQIPKEKGDVKDEAIALMKYLQNPQEEWAGLRGFMFIQYLGGSIASAMVNTTQPLTMTLPYLSQFGFKEAAIALKNGVAMATGAKKIPPGPLQEAIERAEVEGVVNPQEIHQLQAEASRNFGSNIMVRKGLTLWGSLFALAEQFNRRSTFIAAYEMAKAKNMVDPYRFAVNAVEETQGVYNRGNRPNWARGAVGATLFTFKQFSISYLEFLKRLPNREKALALAILMVAAGMQGLPFADDLDDIIDTIAQSLGYSFNVEEEKKKFLTRVLGEGLASFVMHGASTLPGVPLDIQGRLGLGNLIPGTGILKRSETDKTRDIVEVLGPTGGLAKSIAGAASELQGGDIKGAAMQALPVAIQNALKGYDMAQLGMYRDMKGRKVMDTDAYDAFIKTVGFQPAKVAQESRRIQLATQDIALVKRVEGEIVEAWAQGLFEKDLKKSADAARKLMEWNKRNPEAFIRIQPSQIQRRIREMTLTRQQRFVKAAPQEMRAGAQDLTIAPAR